MPVASIDLGSNTVRLIVAEVNGAGFRPIHENQVITRLGQGVGLSRRLGGEGISRTLSAICQFKKEATRYGANQIWVAATSAVRSAENSGELLHAVQAEAGLEIEIIPWEEEGRRMLRGVSYGLDGKLKNGVVFDIGGGSTEFIHTDGLTVIDSSGSDLGVVRLAEKYISAYPAEEAELLLLENEIETTLSKIKSELAIQGEPAMTGTAGTVTTIAALDMGLYPYDSSKINGHLIRKERVEFFARKIACMTLEEILKFQQIESGREDLILPGLLIVLKVMDIWGAEEVVVSDYGLREGLLIDRLFPSG